LNSKTNKGIKGYSQDLPDQEEGGGNKRPRGVDCMEIHTRHKEVWEHAISGEKHIGHSQNLGDLREKSKERRNGKKFLSQAPLKIFVHQRKKERKEWLN